MRDKLGQFAKLWVAQVEKRRKASSRCVLWPRSSPSSSFCSDVGRALQEQGAPRRPRTECDATVPRRESGTITQVGEEVGISWYSVRCVFAVGWPPEAIGETYEERITIWRARSAEEAIARAEAEALKYAAIIEESPSTYIGLAQSYRLSDELTDGAEVFSLMRGSKLAPKEYLDTFFDVGTERQGTVLGDEHPTRPQAGSGRAVVVRYAPDDKGHHGQSRTAG